MNQRAEAMGKRRAAVGIAMLVAPTLPLRLGRDSGPHATAVILMRTIGIRDLALGLGTIAAARSGDDVQTDRWTTMALASDSMDVATSLASAKAIGIRDALAAALLAGLFAWGDIRALSNSVPLTKTE
jgi:hypothetical protein